MDKFLRVFVCALLVLSTELCSRREERNTKEDLRKDRRNSAGHSC